jgi:hypothetical protein
MAFYVYTGSEDVALELWSIRETSKGDRHFVGWNVCNQEGRVSTPIQSLDPIRRTGITASGSRYRLIGRAGHSRDGEYVWNAVVKIRQIDSWRDVTPELVPDWREAVLSDEVIQPDSATDASPAAEPLDRNDG